MRGLHWLSRIHLLTGVLSYATSPIWLIVLTLSSIVVCMDALNGFQYFEPGSYSLFPSWPESRATEIVALLSGTLFVLLMPKVLGATLALVDPELRRGHGGAGRLLASVLVEQVFSTLLAPAMMLFHTTFVVSILAGKPVSWNAQERGDRGIGFVEALNRHKWQIALGLVWGAVIVAIAPRYIWWLLPILAGLLLSVPLTMMTSRASVGRWMRRRGLLLTPEETSPPAELAALAARLAEGPSGGNTEPPVGGPIAPTPVAPATESVAAQAPPPEAVTEGTAMTSDKSESRAEPEITAALESVVLVAAGSLASPHADDILGIFSTSRLPERMPLQMEAAVPVYLRPRDALTGLQRLLGTGWTAS
jgi:membrane glycosyltransferase